MSATLTTADNAVLVNEIALMIADMEPADAQLRSEAARALTIFGERVGSGSEAGRLVQRALAVLADLGEDESSFGEGYVQLTQAIEALTRETAHGRNRNAMEAPVEDQAASDSATGADLSPTALEELEFRLMVVHGLLDGLDCGDKHILDVCANNLAQITSIPNLPPFMARLAHDSCALAETVATDSVPFALGHGAVMKNLDRLIEGLVGLRPEVAVPTPRRKASRTQARRPDPFLDGPGVREYVSDAKDYIELAETALLALENDPSDPAHLHEAFRGFHNLKGSSGFLKLDGIVALAHEAESLLSDAREGDLQLTPDLITLALETLDMLKEMVMQFEAESAAA